MHKNFILFSYKITTEYGNLCLFTLYKYPKFKIKNLLGLRFYKIKYKILSLFLIL